MSSTTQRVIARAQDVTKEFDAGGKSVIALKGLDLDIRDGEFLTLLGPSGCGKSTALNIFGGLLSPTSGRVTVKDEVVDGPRRDIGMMFQKAVMFPWRTTLENVMLPVEVFGWNKREYTEKARELLGVVGLGDFTGAYPWQLSGGMQQRAALCRVLIYDPSILLLDEPFGALDEFTRETMDLELLRLWAQTEKTAVLVTHNINEAVFMSDRIAVMTPRPGRLVGVLEVPFERPRQIELMRTQEFADLVFQARAMLDIG